MKKQQKIGFWISVLVIACHFTGCRSVYYAPTGHNVPLLQEKNEAHLNLGGIMTDYASGLQGQAAYGLTKNIGLIASIDYLWGPEEIFGTEQGHLYEVGAGWFRRLGKEFVIEIYSGGGRGNVVTTSWANPYTFKFSKFFIQPAIGYTDDFAEIMISPKIATVRYDHGLHPVLEYRLAPSGWYVGNPVDFKGGRNFIVFEPAFTGRFGWKYIKIQLQGVYSFNTIPYANKVSVSAGLHLTLADRFRSKP